VALQDLQVQLVQIVRLPDLLAPLERKAFKVMLAPQAHKVSKVTKAFKVYRALLDQPDRKAFKALQDPQVLLV
jgi:hypothetical protein